MAYTTDFNAQLVSKQASKNTKMLYEYLKSIYGKKHLSGQQYLQGEEVEDLVYYHLTGKLPAVRGYDFMGVSSCKKTDDQVDRAIKWATQCGGIVTMCWHCMLRTIWTITPKAHRSTTRRQTTITRPALIYARV